MYANEEHPLRLARRPHAITRQLTTFNRTTRNKTIDVPRGQRVTIGQVEGCGYIAKLWLTFPGWFWQHWAPSQPVSQTILKTLILRIYWDGAAEPAIAVPVGDFFGNGLGEVSSFAAQYFGMSSGGFYCSFPMPFHKGFRIELENLDETIDTAVFSNVLYQLVDELPGDAGYFHAHFHTGENAGPDPVVLLEAQGTGRYVGCTLSMQGAQRHYMSFLEAPEHVQVDDDWESPRIVGTGLEDYFLGGWYFREGPFIGPLHGVPSKDVLNASIAMYRAHDADAFHFDRRLRFTFVNPWEPARLKPFRYSSAAFCYLDRAAGSGPAIPAREQLLCWYRLR
ncbi:MAG: glycoside hydrolase family 172 protein, partial [Phycisphaerae bacterium]